MANSLQDQLRNSGLVSKQKARQASSEKRKKQKQTRAGVTDDDAARREQLAQAAASQAERDRELNRQRQAAADARALAAQITQLIEMNPVDRGDQAISYNYTLDGRVRNIHVSEPVRDALVSGQLALVSDGDNVVLVPAGVARKVADRDASRIVLLNEMGKADDSNSQPGSDDPYAEFKIPDDLMW